MISDKDMQIIRNVVKAEIGAFGKDMEDAVNGELSEARDSISGAHKNILKLQAQLSAMREILIEKGLVSREAYNEASTQQLIKLDEAIKDARRAPSDAPKAKRAAVPLES